MRKWLYIVCSVCFLFTLLSCGSAEEAKPVPSFEVDRITAAARGFADISAPLPQGWDYSVIEETDGYGNEIFGVRFWPTAHPELSVRIGWCPGMTLPDHASAGTKSKIPLSDGSILWHHTRRQGESAQSITVSWDDYPFLYLAEYILPDALEAEYEPIIREILSFTAFGGIRSMYEARDMVTAQVGSCISAGFSDFDLHTGAWCIYVDVTEDAPRRYFYVTQEGVIREYYMEDQPLGGTGIVFRESEDAS